MADIKAWTERQLCRDGADWLTATDHARECKRHAADEQEGED